MSVETTYPSAILDRVDDPLIAELIENPIFESVEILAIREGGRIDCVVPTSLIDHEEVPVRREWAASLARQMREESNGSGSGQHSPIDVGLIEGETKFRIADGFHRDAALGINGEDKRYITVRAMTWDELYDFRIFTAKDHVHVRFSRVVQWVREAWQRSGLDKHLSVEQAVVLYRFESDGSKLGLHAETVASAKDWVARKEHSWDLAAMTILSHLNVAEHVDPKLVHSAREKTDSHSLDAPTQAILKIFSKLLPDRFDMQNFVMDVAMEHNFKGPDVRSLCDRIKDCPDLDSARRIINDIDWDSWEPVYAETKTKGLRKAYDPRQKGGDVVAKPISDVNKVIERIEQFFDRGEKITDEMQGLVLEALERTEQLQDRVGELIVKLGELLEVETVRPEPLPAPQPEVTQEGDIAAEAKAGTNGSSGSVQKSRPVFTNQRLSTSRGSEHSEESPFAAAYRSYLNNETDELPFIDSRSQLREAERVVIGGSFSGEVERREEAENEINEARDRIGRRS